MNKLILFTLFLFLIRDNYAFIGNSTNYVMTHSNVNYGSLYAEGDNYTIDASITQQPVMVITEGNYTISKGFYHTEDALSYFVKLLKDSYGVYPLVILLAALIAALKKENGEKELT